MRRDRTDRARDFLHYVEIFETSILRCSRSAQARDNFFPASVDLLKIAVQKQAEEISSTPGALSSAILARLSSAGPLIENSSISSSLRYSE
jgi:hypothetical protein